MSLHPAHTVLLTRSPWPHCHLSLSADSVLIKARQHKSNLIFLREEDTWFNLVPRNRNLHIFFHVWIEKNSYKQEQQHCSPQDKGYPKTFFPILVSRNGSAEIRKNYSLLLKQQFDNEHLLSSRICVNIYKNMSLCSFQQWLLDQELQRSKLSLSWWMLCNHTSLFFFMWQFVKEAVSFLRA